MTATKVDRLALMETFLRIVDAGSLSAAAKQLGTTQPTISRRLAALEASLGVPLLRRSTRAIQLTETGERYVARARELFAEWRGFESAIRGVEDEPEGTLRVVVPHAFGQERLARPVARFLLRHPRLSIEWHLRDDPVRMVEDGIDCLIRVGPLVGDSLVGRKIHEVRRVVVAAPSAMGGRAPTRPSQLASLPWLALGTFYRHRIRLENSGRTKTVSFQPRLITDSLYALRTAAIEGVGAAVISEWIVRDDLSAGRLVHLLPKWRAPSLPVFIAYPRAQVYPAKLRAFVALMQRVFDDA